MAAQIIQMKISLDYVEPPVWRRFLVDSAVSLDRFHDIIQTIMGWTNSHLYGFTIDGIEYSPADDEFDSEYEDTKGKTLTKLGLRPRQKIKYIYDFGDDWMHTIVVEKIIDGDMGMDPPQCLEGARNCPPEDCGSVPGYEEIVEAMKKPQSEQAREFIDWLGQLYDPEKFDLDDINEGLQYYKKKSRKRSRK